MESHFSEPEMYESPQLASLVETQNEPSVRVKYSVPVIFPIAPVKEG